MKRTIISLAAFLLVFNAVNAQQTETELVRTAFRLEKKEEVAKFMQLTESDAKKFWPIFPGFHLLPREVYFSRAAAGPVF